MFPRIFPARILGDIKDRRIDIRIPSATASLASTSPIRAISSLFQVAPCPALGRGNKLPGHDMIHNTSLVKMYGDT